MSADNSQKTPLARTMSAFTEKKIRDALQLTGKGLPCSLVSNNNSIVTVKFEVNSDFTLPQVTIPMFGPEYIRYPLQPGDKGIVIAVDARLGGVSGLGGGVADLSQPGNLTAIVFLPISNTAWAEVDLNAVTIYGPNGVVLRDEASNTTFVLTPSGIAIVCETTFSLVTGACTFTMNSSGTYLIQGNTGTIKDSTAHTSPSLMNSAWTAMVTYLNAHVHTSGGAGSPTSPPTTPFSGSNIAPSP